MRIIAGIYRSRKLETLAGDNTRPTLDKVKEAVFSSIGPYFDGGSMLDLFSGSGNIGLECISRGIDKAYLCDKSNQAIRIIKTNIDNLDAGSKCVVMRGDYHQNIESLKDRKFKVIYLDPPYAMKVIDEILEFIDKNEMLEADGIIVVESAYEDSFRERYGKLVKVKEKQYRISRISYYEVQNG